MSDGYRAQLEAWAPVNLRLRHLEDTARIIREELALVRGQEKRLRNELNAAVLATGRERFPLDRISVRTPARLVYDADAMLVAATAHAAREFIVKTPDRLNKRLFQKKCTTLPWAEFEVKREPAVYVSLSERELEMLVQEKRAREDLSDVPTGEIVF